MIYHAHDRFLNINTGEIDTYNNQQALNYFNDMLNEGTLVAVKE